MAASGQRLGLHRGVVDGQVVQLLVVLDIGALDGGGALVPTAVIALLVEVVEVGKMPGHAPAGRVIHVGGNKGIKAQLVGALVDVGNHSLEACEVLDVSDVVAGLCDEVGVGDDAVALVAVAHGDELAALVIQVVGIGVELRLDGCALEVQCEVAPLLDAGGIADNEHGRCVGLVHLRGEGLAIGSRRSGHDLGLDALGLLVHVLDGLEGLVELGLEVEPVHLAGCGVTTTLACATACCKSGGRDSGRTKERTTGNIVACHEGSPILCCPTHELTCGCLGASGAVAAASYAPLFGRLT